MRQNITTRKRYSYQISAWVGAGALVLTVLSPVAASAVTGSTTVNASIGSAITISTSSTVSVNVTPTPTGSMSSASDAVTVSTNNSTGYKLTIADTDANVTLVSGANSIAASAGTTAAPVALANNTWGYRVDGVGTFGAGPTTAETNAGSSTTKFAGVPPTSTPFQLKNTAVTATNDITTVWYGVNANSSQPTGTYTDNITYTATTNP